MTTCPRCQGRGWEYVRVSEDEHTKDTCVRCEGKREVPDVVNKTVLTVSTGNPVAELFRCVYNWGRAGIMTDENSPIYLELIKKIKETK